MLTFCPVGGRCLVLCAEVHVRLPALWSPRDHGLSSKGWDHTPRAPLQGSVHRGARVSRLAGGTPTGCADTLMMVLGLCPLGVL